MELDHPWKEPEDNVGGGRSSLITKPQEIIVVKRDEDKQLQRLLNLQKAGDKAVSKMSDIQLKIYQLRYKDSDYHDWDNIGDILGYSHSGIYKIRYKLLELLGKELGYC